VLLIDSYNHRNSALLDPIFTEPVESPSRPSQSNMQGYEPEPELNCIDQLMAYCLARSIDPTFSHESSLQGMKIQECKFYAHI
jgi:hypothetical protein